MHFPKHIAIAIAVLLAVGCRQTRSLTEEYIKNEVEEHEPGALSTIRTYTLYQSLVNSSSRTYLEMTGFKYNGAKGMVIGADRYHRYRAKLTGIPVERAEVSYVILSET